MKIKFVLIAAIASTLAASAWAQSSPQALNLKLPPASAAARNAGVAAVPATGAAANAVPTPAIGASMQADPADPSSTPPALYFPDVNERNRIAAASKACDDDARNRPQIHGSVGAGVVGGNHISGNYEAAAINVSQPLGSCDNPTGELDISISVSKGDFNYSRRRQR